MQVHWIIDTLFPATIAVPWLFTLLKQSPPLTEMFKIIASYWPPLHPSPPPLSEKDKAEEESDPAKLISGNLSSDAEDILELKNI